MFSSKTKVLITGSSGFIGYHLLNNLINENCTIYCFSRRANANELTSHKVQYFEVDLNQKERLFDLVDNIKPDYVIHLAGLKSRSNGSNEVNNLFQNNVYGTLNLFESLINVTNLKQITVLGSIEEYGITKVPFKEGSFENPISFYGITKLSITKLAQIFVKEYNLPITILRPSLVYGPMQGPEMFISSLIYSLSKNKSFSMSKGEQYRDFIYVDDLVEAIKKTLIINNLSGLIINIASGVSYKLSDVARKIAIILDAVEHLHIGSIDYRKVEIMDYEVDINIAKDFLNWKPNTSIDEGISLTIASING